MALMREQQAYALCRIGVAGVWAWHGLVPKLLGPHEDELAITMAFGFDAAEATTIATLAGVGELAFAALLLVTWRQRWPLIASNLAMSVLLAASLLAVPALAVAAFTPVSTNLAVIGLGTAALRLIEP